MSRIKPITIADFIELLRYAQSIHKNKGEPIPELKERQLDSIKSCLNTPFQTFDNKYLYEGFLGKAAILFYLVNKNHALSNGNKRMACLVLAYFYFINEKRLSISNKAFYTLATTVTESKSEDKDETIVFIKKVLREYS